MYVGHIHRVLHDRRSHRCRHWTANQQRQPLECFKSSKRVHHLASDCAAGTHHDYGHGMEHVGKSFSPARLPIVCALLHTKGQSYRNMPRQMTVLPPALKAA